MAECSESFDNIYLDLSRDDGKCRFAKDGFGWKPSHGGDTFTLDGTQIGNAQWSRAARGYELKILDRTSRVIQLHGFQQDDYERLAKLFKNWYGTGLESKEHSLRGWNWGKAEFAKAELMFNVQNRPSFEVPYHEISNTNLAGRNEVSIEFSLPTGEGEANGVAGDKNKGRKAAAGDDQLVEMRFYVPGTTTRKEAEGEQASGDEEEQNAATLFYETLIEKAEIGETAGDTIATFLDVLHLTPRFVSALSASFTMAMLTIHISEAVSISTCTRVPSGCAARLTTTRYSTMPSRSSWCFPSPTNYTICFAWAWTPPSGKVKRDTHSLSCSLRRTTR